jgi:NADH-quinone oxidoreductase subunit F
MIEEVGGGMRGGKSLKAFIPGGSSCPVLTADECEGATMDYDSMAKREEHAGLGRRGHHGRRHLHGEGALRIMRFYAHESCGWCIPCREGTTWLRKMLTASTTAAERARSDIVLIGDLSKNMLGRTFCPLGDAAALPTISIVEKFRDEFEDHLNGKPCPYEHEGDMTVAPEAGDRGMVTV